MMKTVMATGNSGTGNTSTLATLNNDRFIIVDQKEIFWKMRRRNAHAFRRGDSAKAEPEAMTRPKVASRREVARGLRTSVRGASLKDAGRLTFAAAKIYTFDRFDFSKLRDVLGVFFTESRTEAEYYARRGGRFTNGMVRRYRLSFRNVLRVHQGEEYARCVARREGETYRDVRRRLIKAGYDGVRVEYHDGGALEYVAFSNRNIKHVSDNVRYTISEPARIEILKRLSALNRQRWEEEEAAGLHKNGKK